MNNSNIKVGDFVRGWFNKSRFYGVVLEVKKSMVVVDGYRGVGMYDFTTETYPSFTKTGNILNVRQVAMIEKIER